MADDQGTATATHQMQQPTLAEAQAALRRLYGPHTDDVWASLLRRSGLTGEENDARSFDRLVSCMCSAEPVIRICGRSLQLRAATYARLVETHKGNHS